jgi:HEAT repeat protein
LKGSKYRESGYGDVIALDARLTCIIKALQDSDPEIRKGAIWALGYHATMNSLPEPAVAALTDVLRNRHEDICIRKNASWTLGIHLKKMPLAENTMNALIDSLDDRAAIIRTNAVSFIETHIQKSHIKLAFTSHEYLNEARYRPLNRMEIGLIKRGLSAEERAAV